MNLEILARSEEWKSVIADECQNYLSEGERSEALTLLEQLKTIFECGEEFDEEFRKRIVRDNNLHVTIDRHEVCHLSPTVKDAYNLCEQLNSLLPDNLDEPDLKGLDRKRYHFSERGEIAIFRFVRNANMAVIELEVVTQAEEEEEFIYWSKDKLYVMSFVPEADDEHCIAQAFYSL